MEVLPDELLVIIFQHATHEVYQLLLLQIVCKRFYNIVNSPYLWYHLFRQLYPAWASNVHYAYLQQPLVDWKCFVMKLTRLKRDSCQFRLDPLISKRRRKDDNASNDRIQEPLIADIDRENHTGVVAVAKYHENTHKVLFLKYPGYDLIREFKLNYHPSHWSCQITGMQTVILNGSRVRLFSITIGYPIGQDDNIEPEDEENLDDEEDKINVWRTILIYRLFDDGTTVCLANIPLHDRFMGREVYFFTKMDHIKDWLKVISSDALSRYDPDHSIFLLAFGPTLPLYAGQVKIVMFDIRPQEYTIDPTRSSVGWNDTHGFCYIDQSLETARRSHQHNINHHIIATIRLGAQISCMIHFRYPPQLKHLICIGNFNTSEISIYDWRFGVRVGIIPWNNEPTESWSRVNDVQPWGFESTMVIPLNHTNLSMSEIAMYGLRLVAVGDRDQQFEIKVWDISKLLQVHWNPFENRLDNANKSNIKGKRRDNNADEIEEEHTEDVDEEENEEEEDLSFLYDWWERGSKRLKQVALQTKHSLPFTIMPNEVIKVHKLDAVVKYTAYNILDTLLYLLAEDGKLTLMDIETGTVLGSAHAGIGVDVNVLGECEVVITRHKGLLRTVMRNNNNNSSSSSSSSINNN